MKTYSEVVVEGDHIEGRYTTEDGFSCRFRAHMPLFQIAEAFDHNEAAHDEIWALQDGYGSPGYTPPQGQDWSGIRDSSEDAMAKMLAVAESHGFTRDLMMDQLGVK